MTVLIILASSSPRRKELLAKITPNFIAVPADIDERYLEKWTAEEYVMAMAEQKAQTVRDQYPDDCIIGSDTAVIFQDKILGKPASKQEAAEMLRTLSGKDHQVYTSIVISMPTKTLKKLVKAQVTFYPLTEAEIAAYLKTGEYKDKAGAYGIQGKGALLVKEIQGDFYAIVGFPLGVVQRMLQQLDVLTF